MKYGWASARLLVKHPGHVRYIGASAPRHHFMVHTSAVECGLASGLGLESSLSVIYPDQCYLSILSQLWPQHFLPVTTGVIAHFMFICFNQA